MPDLSSNNMQQVEIFKLYHFRKEFKLPKYMHGRLWGITWYGKESFSRPEAKFNGEWVYHQIMIAQILLRNKPKCYRLPTEWRRLRFHSCMSVCLYRAPAPPCPSRGPQPHNFPHDWNAFLLSFLSTIYWNLPKRC